MHRSLRLASLLLLGVSVLTGCSDDQADDPAPTRTGTAPPSPTASPQPSPDRTASAPTSPGATSPATASPRATGTSAGVPALATRCELPAEGASADRVEFAVPGGWQVEEGDCRFLDPELEHLPGGTEPATALRITVADEDFATVSRTEDVEGEIRWVGARSGYQAVRVRGGSAGQALRPAGDPVQLWLVDLDAGTDDAGGALVLRAVPSSGAGFDLAAQAADRIADTLRVVPAATDAGPVVVSRTEGGGAPWTVTLDRDTGCFHLRPGAPTDPPVDEACGIAAPSGSVTGAILSGGGLEVVAGLAPPRATVVESDAATAPYGGVTTSLEGASAFAYRAIQDPLDVRALDAAGRVLGTGTIG